VDAHPAGLHAVLGAEVRQPLAVHRKMLARRAWKYQTAELEAEGAVEGEPARARELGETLKSSASPMLWHGDVGCRAVLLAPPRRAHDHPEKLTIIHGEKAGGDALASSPAFFVRAIYQLSTNLFKISSRSIYLLILCKLVDNW